MGGEMNTLDRLIIICNTYAIRINNGGVLSEDEALFYYAAANYIRRMCRICELSSEAEIRRLEAERTPDDDEDYGAGHTAPITPSPT